MRLRPAIHPKSYKGRGSCVRAGTEKKASDGGVIQHIGHARPDVGYVWNGRVPNDKNVLSIYLAFLWEDPSSLF